MISMITFLYYAILFYGLKYAGYKKFHDDFLSLTKLKCLKGFSALSIIIGHLNHIEKEYRKSLYQTPYGYICFYPAFFFFNSGYGLIKSYNKKNNYLNTFLKKKIINILIPFYLCNVITIINQFYFFYDKSKTLSFNIRFHKIFQKLFLVIPVTLTFWYMLELILLYFLFYITFKYTNNKNISRLLILIFTWILFFIPTYFYSKQNITYAFISQEYYISIYSFIYGLLIGDYEDIILKYIKKYYCYFFIISFFFFPFFKLFQKYHNKIEYKGNRYFYFFLFFSKFNILSILAYSSFLIISMKFQFSNFILNFLGKYSFEIYLYQEIFIFIYGIKQIVFQYKGLGYFIIILLIINLSVLFNFINKYLIEFFNRNEEIIKKNEINKIEFV